MCASTVRLEQFMSSTYKAINLTTIGSSTLIVARPQENWAEGYKTLLVFAEGVAASWAALDRKRETREVYQGCGRIKIHVRLSGQSTLLDRSNRLHSVASDTCTAQIESDGIEQVESFPLGESERSVSIFCSREYLVEELGLNPLHYTGQLRHFIDREEVNYEPLTVTLSLELRLAAEAFFAPVESPFLRRLLLHSRANDIIRIFFDRMARGTLSAKPVRPRDRRAVARVVEILERNYREPPSVRQMAETVGISVSKLSQVFRVAERRTISEYLQSIRMRRALELIQDGRLSITQISYDVGYDYPANFSTAFRKAYSVSPRDAALTMSEKRSRSNGSRRAHAAPEDPRP